MRRVLEHIELVLSAAGLLVISLVSQLLHPGDEAVWRVAAVTAIAVGVIHGVIFWLVRRRQRVIRHDTIQDIQDMLKHGVSDHLTVILTSQQSRRPRGGDGALAGDDAEHLRQVSESVAKVQLLVQSLSVESLRRWRRQYGKALGER